MFPCSDVGLLFGNMEVPYGFFEGDYSHKIRGFKFRTPYLWGEPLHKTKVKSWQYGHVGYLAQGKRCAILLVSCDNRAIKYTSPTKCLSRIPFTTSWFKGFWSSNVMRTPTSSKGHWVRTWAAAEACRTSRKSTEVPKSKADTKVFLMITRFALVEVHP